MAVIKYTTVLFKKEKRFEPFAAVKCNVVQQGATLANQICAVVKSRLIVL